VARTGDTQVIEERRGGRVHIELSPAQVDRVVGCTADRGSVPLLLAGLDVVREALADRPGPLHDGRLSHSLLAGLSILAAMPADGRHLANAEIADRLGMNASTTHRYVSTLLAAGLLERDPSTRRYRLP
jgi:hypothetical protein